MGILSLHERQRVRLFVRKDELGRFFSCLVYVPRDRFTTELVRRIESILVDALGGTRAESTGRVSESVLARLHVIVTVPEGGGVSAPDVPSIEAQLADASRSWTDDLAAELAEHNGEERGIDLLRRYGDAFPAAYREDVDPRSAVGDVQRMESLIAGSAGTDLQSVVTRPVDAPRGFVRMRLFRIGEPMALSDVVPLLEHLGVRVVDERPYEVHPTDAPPLWIYDIGLSSSDLDGLDSGRGSRRLLRGVRAAVEGRGGERRLQPARAARRARRAARSRCSRAYAKYLRQIGSTFSQTYIEDTLAGNAHIAAMLLQLFEARFDPDRTADRTDEEEELVTSITAALHDVASLDEDRILSSLLNLVLATLRTSWYRARRHRRPQAVHVVQARPCRASPTCRCLARCTRCGCTHRAAKACTCGAAASRVAASGGRTGERTSAPRSSA